jgi:hypothetical protein
MKTYEEFELQLLSVCLSLSLSKPAVNATQCPCPGHIKANGKSKIII